jgi:FkbM family methyltransferase
MMPRLLAKLMSRLLLWLRVLKAFRGLTPRSELNLYISAFADTLLYASSSERFNPRLVLGGLFLYRVKGLGIVVVRGGTDDFYHLIPGREGDVEEFMRSCLRNGSVFVDVGANVGYYTLMASKLVGPLGRVHAIEPVPSTACLLKVNVRLNGCGNVIVHEVAAWSSKGEVTLSIPKSFYGCASIVREGEERLSVKAVTLDEMLHGVNSVDLIKIDVEGAEHEVLLGAKNLVSKVKCMVIELSRNAKEVLGLLKQYGFRVKKTKFTTYVIAYRGQ